MRLQNNLGLKLYLILFTIFSFSALLTLFEPRAAQYIYYNTLIRFYPLATAWYLLAILNACLACTSIIPLFYRAFALVPKWTKLFQWLFFLRLIATFIGHNYEFIIVKSSIMNNPLIGALGLGIWMLFVFPSFKEHLIYAFRSKK